ncbi:unnamed protein product [Lupinus luteus]|uniref:RING-type E3 ubiquitin transferase n=1 Tax=Lupinus luteus TaxID=3873 RepID=A0AAV1WXG4_LUPLU
MLLHHRKLASDSSFDCGYYCNNEQSCSLKKNCDDCIKNCNTNNKQSKHFTIPTYLIIIFALIATALIVLCCYAMYVKFFSHRNRSRRRILSQQQENHDDESLDEEEQHGPMVDHPIWYIRTTGLNQSIITAITVCKYKQGEGLIEGTDCSVCLSEFLEDESLRLLPKCNHAFHLPCIDTWLASHTNCPLCRAPVVINAARIPSMESNVTDSSSIENSHMGLENSDDGGSEIVNSDDVLSNGAEEEEVEVEDGIRVVNMQQPRRSVSLDSSSAAKINLELATVLAMESSTGNSKRVGGNVNMVSGVKGSSSSRTRYLQSAPTSMKRSRSFNGKHLLSKHSHSQKKSNAPPVRSF